MAAEGSTSSSHPPSSSYPPDDEVGRVLVSEADVVRRTMEIGAEITADLAGETPLLVGVLKGSVIFIADLMRAIGGPVELDFLAVSSYGEETRSSGVVKILKDLDRSLEGVDLMVVEDIVDTGLTLRYLLENLATRKPRSLGVCALLDKVGARKEPVEVRHVGFECPNEFVVGYGLDFKGRYRNLPYIGVLRESVYRNAADS